MQSKRDQVQAHGFLMGRLSSGLLMADPDAPESPLGRTTRGVLFGLLVTLLIAAGATVYGLLRPGGNDAWRSGENLVVNRETGARYLYIEGTLHPVRNYASARLIGGGRMTSVDVATASLRGAPVGAPVGIPGAPDAVPGPGDLDGGAWHMCVTGAGGALPSTGSASDEGVHRPGATTVVAGAPLRTRPVGGDRGVLVLGPDEREYLVWRGSRLRVDEKSDARNALGYGSEPALPVSAAFLDALAPGPDLAPPNVPGRGKAGPRLGGEPTRVGQVFTVAVPGGSSSYHLLRADGLTPLTRTGAALVLGDPATQKEAYGGQSPTARTVGADALRQHRAASDARLPDADEMPSAPPLSESVPRGTAICAKVLGGSEGARISTVLAPLEGLAPAAVADGADGAVEPACVRPDVRVVRPGRGALVRALHASGAAHAGTTYLVAENGVKHRVASEEALSALGYGQGDIGSIPAPLLATLPTGPDLDKRAAGGAAPPRTTAPACGGKKETARGR
ncbi:type VII secretion protein EccB [Streptomyces sp. V2I9]|uniref:type VII secretion protein EccB n=1 Tax=Streptomyces sp. V2I9 TaxID=3042304 RepID=UPI002788C5CE|nr:type VII secretion protein EccB [Streptomyces sp. V2I9]MDQ0988461.1 type VII secretion protein EccB [Streptomyces sp. V2I9]